MVRFYTYVKRLSCRAWSGLLPRSNQAKGLFPQTGIPVTATIWGMKEEGRNSRGLVQIRCWVMIKGERGVTCRHITSRMNPGDLPAVGDKIRICYCPNDLSKVIILSAIKPNQHI